MIVVIQCAASKNPDAGHLTLPSGKLVKFVDDPCLAPIGTEFHYAHPDDQSGQGMSWRNLLLEYNSSPGENLLGLLPAYRLYHNRTYRELVEHLGSDKVFILSAGWGLIRSDFLTPAYDIAFSHTGTGQNHIYKRRSKKELDSYADLRQLPADCTEKLVFFGGAAYLPLFQKLTVQHQGPRIVFYRTKIPPIVPKCELKHCETRARTNWHYQLALRVTQGTSKFC